MAAPSKSPFDAASMFGQQVHTPESRVSTIGEALRHVQMSGIFYCPSELTEPWGLTLPPMDRCVWFHVVTSGVCTIEVDGHVQSVSAGDLVLVPHGTGHRAWGADPAPTPLVFDLPHEEISDQYAILRHGGGGVSTHVVCGGIRFDHPAAQHLVQSLPALIHIEGAKAERGDWLSTTLDLIAAEVQHARPGNDAVVSRLCDIIVIQAIRSWIERDAAAGSGWLAALHDDQIGRAIAAIHSRPGDDWTVAALADEVAMSRSAFAARFTSLVGEPAMQYVTRWRMSIADDLLRTSTDNVAAIGARVGYDSEAAFSRAYKRLTGTAPGAARRSFASA